MPLHWGTTLDRRTTSKPSGNVVISGCGPIARRASCSARWRKQKVPAAIHAVEVLRSCPRPMRGHFLILDHRPVT
jgi:threonine dehydrogenase-like Zn-dependent dehydrogenase